jgi:hypothetical protein
MTFQERIELRKKVLEEKKYKSNLLKANRYASDDIKKYGHLTDMTKWKIQMLGFDADYKHEDSQPYENN